MMARTILALLLVSTPVAADVDPMTAALAEAAHQPYERAAEVVTAIRAAGAVGDEVPMLASIAKHESHLRKSVEVCAKDGDDGDSHGLFQERTGVSGPRRDRICNGGLRVQAVYALMHLRAVKGPSMAATIARYAGRPVDHPIVLARVKLAARLAEVQ